MISIKNQDGFTLVELLMALAVFSTMLMVVVSGFIQVTHIYESGMTSRATQQNARLIIDDFSKIARSAAKAVVVNVDATHSRICLYQGGRVLTYLTDASGNLRQGVMTDLACGVPADVSGWRTVNDSTVKITQFLGDNTQAVGYGQGTVSVKLTAASVTNLDNLNAAGTNCTGGPWSQWCAVTTLSTTAALSGEMIK